MRQAFITVGLGALFSTLTYSQAITSSPAFEVASVKVNTSGGPTTGNAKGNTLTLYNMPMRVIIARAFQVPNDRITGPDWLNTDGFDILAKPGPGTTADTLWLMLQNLLAERFKLAIHHEQKPTPVYALVVSKKGPRLQEAAADSEAKSTCNREGIQVTCEGKKLTMAGLVQNLPRWLPHDWLDLPVVDQTGLPGVYNFSLTWTLTNRRDDQTDPPGDSLFEAIQDQLGLKLEQRKVLLDRIVIDHIDRVPTPN